MGNYGAILAALKKGSNNKEIKIIIIDSAGNVISDLSLSALRDALRGTDNRTLTDLYNTLSSILSKAYDDVADLEKVSIERDNVGLATEATLDSINTKLAQSLLAESALSYDNSAGTTTADYTVFSSDISIDFNGSIVIQIIMDQSTTVQVKVTPAGQTTAYTGYLNAGSSLSANSWYEFEMNVNNGDALNIIIQVPAGAVLSGYLRIFKRER